MKFDKSESKQIGFTLIELMVVVFMIAIIASIALPSYQRYIVQNAEKSAQAEIKQLQTQLDKWRSSRLTFLGFVPELGETVCGTGVEHCYNNTANTLVYVPLGSDSTNYKYMLTLVDGSNSTSSLVPVNTDDSDTDTDSSAVNFTVGRSWKVFAVPNSGNSSIANAHKIMLTSTGVQCMTKDDDISITSSDCGDSSTAKSW